MRSTALNGFILDLVTSEVEEEKTEIASMDLQCSLVASPFLCRVHVNFLDIICRVHKCSLCRGQEQLHRY